ncbi:alpha/beta hydrolase [Rhodoplanes sp. TEM]|uniref:Alpha/beta hydrolase n=1 Tax=Rhodoplanes tepidamans TaxID=200616 RepID=A0ABT5JJP3_RHOTP|nr:MULTISPECIES: alpha/beta hydrolase [Rhodoplanes]MDC7789806.1 alpha/beta hydrolase [Rhodoplanes tepidamans]MDC7985559.1 alpha/beta hydrolase [Rhodoplanes sp. TEM]MDQ0355287.1 dienelactone hydrolase [Rhodoplanes tepidamans]
MSQPTDLRAAPVADARGAPHVRRFAEQRWVIDNVIRANGIDWDQPRSVYLNGPCGTEANADFAGIRERVKKMADIGPAFEAVARRREAKAQAAEADGHLVTARDNYYMAAVHWAAAQWPYERNDAPNLFCNERKRACFGKYAALADHRVEPVWIPFEGRALPAWFHLPPNYAGGRVPVVIAVPGMDSFKEAQVALANDRFLARGVAVLAIDGPGQYEAPILGIYFSTERWAAAGKPIVDWLVARPEVDAERIGVSAISFGSFFGTILTAHEPRIKACAVMSVCHEPGGETIFQQACPTFKTRFMYMSGISDEAEFDDFRKTITWEGHAERITAPYLCVAGECEELSPLEHSERLLAALKGPKRFVVYQESRHSVGNVAATNLGPFPTTMIADWLLDRLNGRPMASERWFVRATGQIEKTPL